MKQKHTAPMQRALAILSANARGHIATSTLQCLADRGYITRSEALEDHGRYVLTKAGRVALDIHSRIGCDK